MGWASGSYLFDEVIKAIQDEFPDDFDKRKNVYRKLILAFENYDWDTQNESVGLDSAYDSVFNEMYGEVDD